MNRQSDTNLAHTKPMASKSLAVAAMACSLSAIAFHAALQTHYDHLITEAIAKHDAQVAGSLNAQLNQYRREAGLPPVKVESLRELFTKDGEIGGKIVGPMQDGTGKEPAK